MQNTSNEKTNAQGGKLVNRAIRSLAELYPEKAEQLRYRVGRDEWPDIRIMYEMCEFLIRSASY